MCVFVYVRVRVGMYACACVWGVCLCVCLSVCLCVCLSVCVCVCACARACVRAIDSMHCTHTHATMHVSMSAYAHAASQTDNYKRASKPIT